MRRRLISPASVWRPNDAGLNSPSAKFDAMIWEAATRISSTTRVTASRQSPSCVRKRRTWKIDSPNTWRRRPANARCRACRSFSNDGERVTLKRSWAAVATLSTFCVTTYPVQRTAPRNKLSGWRRADCTHDWPWSVDSWRCGNKLGPTRPCESRR